ncbi:hypothetical protein Scep_020079 [Stephania cephalantha]|uniref:Uncharacterized protein n=1 Tax=Stephania cephalantha TaxID=152367 RepID=A0AAP0ICE5_9MAGN
MELLLSMTFNVILVNLSHDSCLTFRPLRNVAPPSFNSRLIIGMINDRSIHWVGVKLKVMHHFHHYIHYGKMYADECAEGWRNRFIIREIVPVVPSQQGTPSVVDLASP